MGKSRVRTRREEMHMSSMNDHFPPPEKPAKAKSELEPKTEAQRRYINSIRHNKVTFGIGPAGVGKTYVAARLASEMLLSKRIERIYLTRPAVEVGESIGFLPGELEEKMAPYIASYGAGFRDGLGKGHFEYLSRTKRIEIVPLNFMQGLSFDEPSMVLFDEAENATVQEMKMFLTRIGEGARVVIDGDPDQTMIKSKSGLIDGLSTVRYIDQVSVVEFSFEDVVRSGFVKDVLMAYHLKMKQTEDLNERDLNTLPSFISGQKCVA